MAVLSDVVHNVKEFGMKPCETMFFRSIEVFCYLKILNWEKKISYFLREFWLFQCKYHSYYDQEGNLLVRLRSIGFIKKKMNF